MKMESSEQSHIVKDSLPVVDLRLLSQTELLSLSHTHHDHHHHHHHPLFIPKIDPSVFNESAGSRKQTFSRLRLAPSAAAAARRSQSLVLDPPLPDSDSDSFQIIGLLKQLFPDSNDHHHFDSALQVNRASSPSLLPSRGFPNEIVLGLLHSDGDELSNPVRGRPLQIKPEGSSRDDVSLPADSLKWNSDNVGGVLGTLESGSCLAVSSGSACFGNIVAPVSTPLGDMVSSESMKENSICPKENPKPYPEEETVRHSVSIDTTALDNSTVLLLPVSLSNVVSNSQYASIDPVPVFSNEVSHISSAGISSTDGDGKRKRGRPRKGESIPVSSAKKVIVKKAVLVHEEGLEKVNVNGKVVDLAVLGSLKDPFDEELRRRTQGLATESELIGFLEGLAGDWGSRRRKKKVVQASEFGDALPKGWKIQLCPKRRDTRAWLICRRYISPGGQQFVSCKEVSSYLLATFRFQDEAMSESGLANAGIQVAHKVGSEIDANLLFEDQKNADQLPTCSNLQHTLVLSDSKEKLSFDEKNDTPHHLLSSHMDLTWNQYDNHILLHAGNSSQSNKISRGLSSMPKKSDPVSNCILSTSPKLQKLIGVVEENPPSSETNDKLDYRFLHGNLKADAHSENCMEKERTDAASCACRYDHSNDFVSFSHKEMVANGSKDDNNQGCYKNLAKTSYLTDEELGKLDEPWPEKGFQSNVYSPCDAIVDNNSSNGVVDMIRVDKFRKYKASEFSVTFDGKYTRTDADTIRRLEDNVSKRSLDLLSSYECEHAFEDSLMSSKKASEVKWDINLSVNDVGGQSENAQSHTYTNDMEITSLSSVEKFGNTKVKRFWNDKELHAYGSVENGMDAIGGKSTVINSGSNQFSQVISGSGHPFPHPNDVPCNSSKRASELKPSGGTDFGLIYRSGHEQMHPLDNVRSMLTSTLSEQQKLDGANQFRNIELESESAHDSRPCRYDLAEPIWRTNDQNFQPGRLTDSTAPMQISGCFSDFNLLPNKDAYGDEDTSVSARFTEMIDLQGIGESSTQQLRYNFPSVQETSDSNNSRGLSQKQDDDPFFWFSKEDTSLFSKTANRFQTLTVCVWCRKEFCHHDVSSQMKSGPVGVICSTCQAKFVG